MLQLYGFHDSQPVRAVEWLLKLKNIDYEMIQLDPNNASEVTPEFLKLNPSGLVPVLKDGSFVLYEGAAILIYLCEKHAWTDVYPANLEQRAKVHQYLHWHHTNARNSTRQILKPFIHKATDTATPEDLAFIKKKDEIIGKFTAVMEKLLKEELFIAETQQPTIADYFAYTEVDQLETMGVFDFAKFPKVHAWLARMKEIPHHDEIQEGTTDLLELLKLKQ